MESVDHIKLWKITLNVGNKMGSLEKEKENKIMLGKKTELNPKPRIVYTPYENVWPDFNLILA